MAGSCRLPECGAGSGFGVIGRPELALAGIDFGASGLFSFKVSRAGTGLDGFESAALAVVLPVLPSLTSPSSTSAGC